MKSLATVLVFLLLVSAAPLAVAQTAALGGPLLAVTTAEQDRILLYDVSSGVTRSLSFGDGWHTVWSFSPDGCRIAFTRSDGLNFARLYTARLNGTGLRELVQFDELPARDWGVWAPKWSPTEPRIAFTFIRSRALNDGSAERQYHIAWVDAAGGPPNLYSVSGDEHEPDWSPDGRWLAYIAFSVRVAGTDIYSTAVPTQPADAPLPLLREADLWLVSADGAARTPLAQFATGSVRGARWSPDGDLIGFIYSPSPGNDQFWMIGSQPGALPTQLSAEWSLILDLTWLPDSSALLSAVRDFRDTRDNRLWRIPLVGSADTDATLFLDDPALNYADYPRFSADGRWLAQRSAYALALVDTHNGGWTLLDELVLGNTPPVWSPAGFAGEAACPPD